MLTEDQLMRIIVAETNSAPQSPSCRSAARKIAELLASDNNINVEAAVLENEVTSTLMDMLAATILASLIEEEGGGRTNIRFSPGGMQEILARWDYTVEHDGMIRNVLITPKDSETWEEGQPASKLESLLLPGDEGDGAKPQAAPKVHDRPVWAIFYYDKDGKQYLAKMLDRNDATRHLSDYETFGQPQPEIQNRFCTHIECPTTGCTKEVTSES